MEQCFLSFRGHRSSPPALFHHHGYYCLQWFSLLRHLHDKHCYNSRSEESIIPRKASESTTPEPYYFRSWSRFTAEKLRCNVPHNATSIVSATVHNLLFMTSFGSIMALSVNRFVAIQMPLRYQNIVTYKRAVTAVATIWFSSAVFILCTLFVLQRNIAFAIFIIIEIVCFITTTLSSCKIYFVLKRHKNEIQSQRQQVAQNNNMLNTVGLTKSASCTFWIYLAFWLCYLPFIIIMITEMCLPNTVMEALFMCSETIVLLNSSLNPIIYCWKMRHVRHAVKSILRNIFRSFNGQDGRTVNETL